MNPSQLTQGRAEQIVADDIRAHHPRAANIRFPASIQSGNHWFIFAGYTDPDRRQPQPGGEAFVVYLIAQVGGNILGHIEAGT